MNDPDTVMSQFERHRQARAKLSEGNKGVVFDALAAANITQVHVEFDGEGDSGQIESVLAFRGEERAELSDNNRRHSAGCIGRKPRLLPRRRPLKRRLKPSATTTSKKRMAIGKTMRVLSVTSASTSP